MANSNEDVQNYLAERMSEPAALATGATRINSQDLGQPDAARPAPLESTTQGNESNARIPQNLNSSADHFHGSSTVGTTTSAMDVEPTDQEECMACLDKFPLSELENLLCSHYLCDSCLVSMFKVSLTSEELFPPHCCREPILISPRVLGWLPAGLTMRVLDKMAEVEMDRLEHKRTYCHVPRCSTLVPRGHIIGNKAACRDCRALTCIVCKEKYHDDGVCAKKGGFQAPEVEKVAEREGWKRCQSCGQMIERIEGCNRMRQWSSFSMPRYDIRY